MAHKPIMVGARDDVGVGDVGYVGGDGGNGGYSDEYLDSFTNDACPFWPDMG